MLIFRNNYSTIDLEKSSLIIKTQSDIDSFNSINLESYQRFNRIQVNTPPEYFQNCIYILFYEEEIVYIGQTTNMGFRLKQHDKEGTKEWDSFTVIPIKSEFTLRKRMKNILFRIETVLINRFDPKYNKTTNKFGTVV